MLDGISRSFSLPGSSRLFANASKFDQSSLEETFCSITITLSSLTKNLLKNIPSNRHGNDIQERFTNYLSSSLFLDDETQQIIQKIGSLFSMNPEKNFTALRHCFFRINMNVNRPITSQEIPKIHFLNRNSSFIDDKNIYVRISLYYLMNYLILNSIDSMLFYLHFKQEDQISFLYYKYIKEILHDIIKYQEIKKAFSNLIILLEKVIKHISIIAPKSSFQFLSDALKNRSNSSLIFRVFRSMHFPNNVIFHKQYMIVSSYYISAAQTNNITEEQENISLFFMNLISKLLLGGFIEEVEIFKQTINKKSAFFLPIITTFFSLSDSFSREYSVDSILKFSSLTLAKCLGSEMLVLSSLKQLLVGKTSIFDFDYDQIIKSQMSQQNLTQVVAIIMENGLFNQSIPELTNIIVLLALNNFKLFISDFFPIFTSSNFMLHSGISIFDSIKRIIIHPALNKEYKNEMQQLKSQMIELCTLYIMEYHNKRGSCIFQINQIPDEVTDLISYSIPRQPVLPPMKRFQSDINKWKTFFSQFQTTFFDSSEQICLRYVSDLQQNHSPIMYCIALVPYVGYSDNLMSVLLPLAFTESSHLALLSINSAFMIIKQNLDYVTQILMHFVSIETYTNEQLYIKLVVVNNLVKYTSNPEDFIDTIFHLIIIGLCSDSYQIRGETLKLIDSIPSLSRDFEDHSSDIFSQSISMIADIMSYCGNSKMLMNLPPHSFREIAASSYNNIYYIYLSLLFSSTKNENILNLYNEIRSSFTKISMQKEITDYSEINLCTYLAATATGKDIKDLFMTVTKYVLEGGNSRYFILYSFAASFNDRSIPALLDLFTGPDELYKRVFTFSSRIFYSRCKSTDIINSILDSCDLLISFCDASNIVSSSSIQIVDSSLIDSGNTLIYPCLIDFMKLITMICDDYGNEHMKESSCLFLKKKFPETSFSRNNMFKFIYNIAASDDPKIGKLVIQAQIAFSSFCSVTQVGENEKEMYQFISSKSSTYILSQSYSTRISSYIKKAIKYQQFFESISDIFEDCKNLHNTFEMIKYRLLKQDDIEFSQANLDNVGQLLSLCFLYLTNPSQENQPRAISILNNIIICLSLLMDDKNFVQIFRILDSHESNYELNSLKKLSKLLSQTLEFCTKNFVYSSLYLRKHRANAFYLSFLRYWMNNQFLQLSTISFFKRFIKGVCQTPLQLPAIDLLNDILHDSDRRFLFFVLSYFYSKKYRKPCKLMIINICQLDGVFIEYLSLFFQFDFWYYVNIQHNFKESGNYKDAVSFFSEVAFDLKSFNPNLFLSQFTFGFLNCDKHILNALIGINKIKISHISRYVKDINAFVNLCFPWAVSCGNFEVAALAAKCVTHYIETPTDEQICLTLRTLHFMMRLLHEGGTIYYISKLINMLSVMNIKATNQNPKVIKCFMYFFTYDFDKRMEPILFAVTQAMSQQINQFPNILANEYSCFGLIISLTCSGISLTSKKPQKIMISLYNLIIEMFMSGYHSIFFDKLDISSAALICLPFILTTKRNISKFSSMISMNANSPEIVSKLVNSADANNLPIIVKFYNELINYLHEYSEQVFIICLYLLRSKILNDNVFQTIIFKAIRAKEKDSCKIACEFISNFHGIQDLGPIEPINPIAKYLIPEMEPGNFSIPFMFPLEIDLGKMINEIEIVEVQPFTEWELIIKNTPNDQTEPVQRIQIREITEEDILRVQSQINQINEKDKKNKQNIPDEKAKEEHIDDYSSFLIPSLEEIDIIGMNILGQDFPSLL